MSERRRVERREPPRDGRARPSASRARRGAPPTRRGTPPRYASYPPQKQRRKKRKNPLRVLFGWVIAAASALVLAIVLRTFVFTIIQIGSVSMNDTIRQGDVILMTRYDYWINPPVQSDIVAFSLNGDTALSFRRVVAGPGDLVEFVDGDVSINGEHIEEPYVTNPDGSTFMPVEIPSGYYMLLGDNRGESVDSRSEEVGLVAKSQIEGKAAYIIWPPARMGPIDETR